MAKSLCRFADIGKLWTSRKFLTSQIFILTLFAKINFRRKIPNLQYQNYYSEGKSYQNREFIMSQICLLTLYSKIEVWRTILNLHYFFQMHTF